MIIKATINMLWVLFAITGMVAISDGSDEIRWFASGAGSSYALIMFERFFKHFERKHE